MEELQTSSGAECARNRRLTVSFLAEPVSSKVAMAMAGLAKVCPSGDVEGDAEELMGSVRLQFSADRMKPKSKALGGVSLRRRGDRPCRVRVILNKVKS